MMERYAQEILELSGKDKEISKEIAEKLVNDFIAHEQVINANSAKELGLNIKDHLEYKEEWETLRNWLAKNLLKSANKHIIRYYVSDECKKENFEVKKDDK